MAFVHVLRKFATGLHGCTMPRRCMAVQPRAFQAPVAAPAQQAVRRQAAANQSYIVAPGDTLALIAIKLYGSALATDRLLQDNPTLRQNPNALRIGQVLQYSLR